MQSPNLEQLFEDFNSLKALVIGDVMIDAYLWGGVDRISPEAPVPIVQVDKKESRLGGAANVALNLHAMGAEPIICTVIGDDDSGRTFNSLLEKRGLPTSGTVASSERVTTVKTRIISSGQHMLRVDEEQTDDLSPAEERLLIDRVIQLLDQNHIDVIVFEDYNKGVLTETVIAELIDEALKRSIPTTVDPKKKNFFSFQRVDLFKPNLKELKEGLKLDFEMSERDDFENAVQLLRERLPHQVSLITLSEYGIYHNDGQNKEIIPAHNRKILDVSGAGDTVISVASLCLALKTDLHLLAALANLSGGQVCEKVGVVPVDKEQLLAEAKRMIELP